MKYSSYIETKTGSKQGEKKMNNTLKLDEVQIKTILDKMVPLIAKPEDHESVRAIIGLFLSELNSTDAALFIRDLLARIPNKK